MNYTQLIVGIIVGGLCVFAGMFAGGGQSFGKASGAQHLQTESFLQGLTAGTRDQFQVSNAGKMSFGTSTPSAQGDMVLDGTGTTTVMVVSSGTLKGGCLQLDNAAGVPTKAYIAGTAWVIAAGTCK